ncbi:MAG: DUF2905 domain-containing protein [Pirellulales bacterium]
MNAQPAVILILIGLLLAVVGLAWLLLPNIPWLGRLPGDIRWEGEHGGFYFPIVTCLLLSLLLSFVLWLLQQFWR